MQLKNYKVNVEDFFELIKEKPDEAKELFRDIIHEYNSIPCGISWKTANPVIEHVVPTVDNEKVDIDDTIPYIVRANTDTVIKNNSGELHRIVYGDNYSLLKIMQDKFQRQIGLVYCDVPYNLGRGDFTFNCKSVDATDSWRDAKWLSFMNKRLRLIKNLLAEHGIIAVSINDTELAQLTLLMDEIFGKNNRIAICPVESNPRGISKRGILVQHDYLLLYTRNINKCIEKVHRMIGDKVTGFATPSSGIIYFKLINKNDVQSSLEILCDYIETKTGMKIKRKELKSFCEKNGLKATYDELCKKQYTDSKGPFSRYSITKAQKGKISESQQYTVWYLPPDVYMDRQTVEYKRFLDEQVDYKPYMYTDEMLKDPSFPKEFIPYLKPIKPAQNQVWTWSKATIISEIEGGTGENLMVTFQYDDNKNKSYDGRTYLLMARRYMGTTDDSVHDDSIQNKIYTVEHTISTKIFPSILRGNAFYNTSGTSRLTELIGNNDLHCKPVEMLEILIATFANRGDIVADFFAGTGTTLEAVLNVNEGLGMDIRCILCEAYLSDVLKKRFNALSSNTSFRISEYKICYEKKDNNYSPMEDINIINKLCEKSLDYYKFVYNLEKSYNTGNDKIECYTSDHDGVMLLISKKSTGINKNTANSSGFKAFLNKSQNDETGIQDILNSVSSSNTNIYNIVIQESDTRNDSHEGIYNLCNYNETYPIGLLESINYAQESTCDKNITYDILKDSANNMDDNEEQLREMSVSEDIDCGDLGDFYEE